MNPWVRSSTPFVDMDIVKNIFFNKSSDSSRHTHVLGADFLGSGCDKALFGGEKGFFSEKGGGIQ